MPTPFTLPLSLSWCAMATKHNRAMVQVLLVQLTFAFLSLAVGGDTSTTHLRFYMHDTVTGSSPTAVRVVRGAVPLPNDDVNLFGDLYVIDDPLTELPDAASPTVGRAQGFYLFASRSDQSLLLCADLVFTAESGKRYGGGTLSVLARDAILDEVRELPVVGGAGRFRGAVGYGLLRTHSYNASNNNAVLQIDMYINV
jgi:hypothetical protein